MDETLSWLQITAHLLTFSSVALWYQDREASYRVGVSLLATGIAGASLGAGLKAMIDGQGSGLFPVLIIVIFCGIVLRAGGNVAKLLPTRAPGDRVAKTSEVFLDEREGQL